MKTLDFKKLLPIFLLLISFSASAKKMQKFNGPYWHDFDFVNKRGKSIVYLPEDYDAKKKYPLLISLHGFGGGANLQNTLFDFRPLTTKMQFILINPDGLKGTGGLRFWNASDFCCNYNNQEVDDVEYLKDLIQGMSEEYSVDLERVHLFGHSNGGFMSHRLACDAPELIASMVSFAGVSWKDFSLCKGKKPVPLLQIHGTKDFLIKYSGNSKHPGAEETVQNWVNHNNCVQEKVHTQSFNTLRPGNMKVPFLTTREKIWTDCDEGATVALWKVKDGDHLMTFNKEYLTKLVNHLFKFKRN